MASSSGEIYILNKLGELASRYGASPLSADIYLTFNRVEDGMSPQYSLSMVAAGKTEEEEAIVEKIGGLLGLDDRGMCDFANLEAIEQTIDHALSLAPRTGRFR
jgi:hypothetical protein